MDKTVLVVDDVPAVRKTISDILTTAGYKVVGEAGDGAQALEVFTKTKPSVVTLDIVMPNVSGMDALKKIMKQDRDAKVIILSAMGQEHLVQEAIHLGAKDYMLKPFVAQELIRAIERVMSDSSDLSARMDSKAKSG